MNAQNPPRENGAPKPLVKFDWNCASRSVFPRAALHRIVIETMKAEDFSGIGSYGDRAFAFDLNGDHQKEYFVPLDCGGTGNCVWGVFALNPTRRLGLLTGKHFYVYRETSRWPEIVSYAHLSATEGSLTTYRFEHGIYSLFGDAYPITHGNNDLDNQGGNGNKLPSRFEKAKPACESPSS